MYIILTFKVYVRHFYTINRFSRRYTGVKNVEHDE